MLVIRLHALGDVALTLPASAALRSRFPDARIDYMTTETSASLVASLRMIDEVTIVSECKDPGSWAAGAVRMGLLVRKKKYDVILDLQRNWVTRTIRRLASPAAWGEFDRFAPMSAGDRVIESFHRTGFAGLSPLHAMEFHHRLLVRTETLLRDGGRDPKKKLVVLNPAGLWKTRNWPLENYILLARLWLRHEPVQFLVVGTDRISDRAAQIQHQVGDSVINLVNRTSPGEAFAVLHEVSAMVTEDSGLMHMGWCLGIPTVALFGSSRRVWSAPVGPHNRCLHSGDLPCGQCMESLCRYGDVHCLTRHTPQTVFRLIQEMLSNRERIAEGQ